MKPFRSVVLTGLLAVLVMLIGVWLAGRRSMGRLPTTGLFWEGLTNFPPAGAYTGFRLSNGAPRRLVYAPRNVEHRGSAGAVVMRPGEIIDCVGVLDSGEEYVFYVPGTVTNGTLVVDLEVRGKAQPGTFLGRVEGGLSWLLNRPFLLGNGTVSSDVWLGGVARGELREAIKPPPPE